MLFQLNIPNSYSKSNCKVNLFPLIHNVFCFFLNFIRNIMKENRPIRINNDSDRHTYFYLKIALSLTQWQAITYCKIKCLMFHVIFITPTLVFSTSCKWKMVCGIKTKVLVIVGETKWNG